MGETTSGGLLSRPKLTKSRVLNSSPQFRYQCTGQEPYFGKQ
jgi:hypothetical protein